MTSLMMMQSSSTSLSTILPQALSYPSWLKQEMKRGTYGSWVLMSQAIQNTMTFDDIWWFWWWQWGSPVQYAIAICVEYLRPLVFSVFLVLMMIALLMMINAISPALLVLISTDIRPVVNLGTCPVDGPTQIFLWYLLFFVHIFTTFFRNPCTNEDCANDDDRCIC